MKLNNINRDILEPSVGFEPTCPYGSALQVRRNRPLCEEGNKKNFSVTGKESVVFTYRLSID